MDKVKPSPLPVSHPGRWIEPLKVPPGPPIKVIICSEFYVGYTTHWLVDKKVVCNGNPSTCQGCLNKLDNRWDGGIIVTYPDYRHPYILPLTSGGVKHCKALQDRNGNLRGLPLIASRLRKTKFSGLRLELMQPEPISERLLPLPTEDIVEALSRLWKIPLEGPSVERVSYTPTADGVLAPQSPASPAVWNGTQDQLFAEAVAKDMEGPPLSRDSFREQLRKAGFKKDQPLP